MVKKHLRDMAIKKGCDEVDGMQIEDDYLRREYYENRREAGFEIPDEALPTPRSSIEISIFKANKNLEECEGERVNRNDGEYDGHDEEEELINWQINNPKRIIVV
jgi:hypothetical protein